MAFHRDPDSMRRFYDGFHPWYRFVEGVTGRSVRAALGRLDPEGLRYADDSVIEHCCGTGSLALEMAPLCASYAGRDQSGGMLGKARLRWRDRFGEVSALPFASESVLDFASRKGNGIDQGGPDAADWHAIAFALHLFPPHEESAILTAMWRSSRKGMIVIDHVTGFSPFLSFVEMIEGSWYEHYRKMDFGGIASDLGAVFADLEVDGARVMEFTRPAGA